MSRIHSEKKFPFSILIKGFVALCLIAFVTARLDIRRVGRTIYHANTFLIVASSLIVVIQVLLRTLSWRVLLFCRKIRLSMKDTVSLYLIGVFFNTCLPGNMGGDAVRIYYLHLGTGDIPRATAGVLLDRIITAWAMLFLASIALAFHPSIPQFITSFIWTIPLIFILLSLGLLILLFPFPLSLLIFITKKWPKITRGIEHLSLNLVIYRHHPWFLLLATILAIPASVALLTIAYLSSLAIGGDISFSEVLLTVPLVYGAASIPVSVSGIGIQEGTFVLLFSEMGFTMEKAFSLALLYRFFQLLIALAGGVCYFLDRHKKPPL